MLTAILFAYFPKSPEESRNTMKIDIGHIQRSRKTSGRSHIKR